MSIGILLETKFSSKCWQYIPVTRINMVNIILVNRLETEKKKKKD